MTIQNTPPTGYDGIDLRKWTDLLVRRWWLVLSFVVLFATGAGVFSYGFQASTYVSSAGGTLPPGISDNTIQLTERGYQEFASSTPVMESVGESLGLGMSASELRNHYTFTVDENRFITATATARSAEQAFRLADTWTEVYNQELLELHQEQLTDRKSILLQEVDSLQRELESARKSLADFDLENPLTVLESQAGGLEDELVQGRLRLQELRTRSLPDLEGALASLQGSLRADRGTLGGGGSPSASPGPIDSGLGALVPGDATANSPAYFELGQDLVQAQLSSLAEDLVADEGRLRELTLNSIPIAQARVASLEEALTTDSAAMRRPAGTSAPGPVHELLGQELSRARVELEIQQEEVNILNNKIAITRRQIDELKSELVSYQTLSENLRAQLDLRQEIKEIEAELAAGYREAESLESSLPSLEDHIKELRREVIAAKEARQDLQAQVTRLSGEYGSVKSELDRLSKIGPDLAALSSLSTIREPALPSKPVSPQKERNTILAAVLGLFVGAAAVLFWDYYRAQPSV